MLKIGWLFFIEIMICPTGFPFISAINIASFFE